MFKHIDWHKPSVCEEGWWLHQEQEAKTPDGSLEFVITVPPPGKDSMPEALKNKRPLLVFLTGSDCHHIQHAWKCPQEKHARKVGMRICLSNYFVVSVTWTKAKKKGFNTQPPAELYPALDELAEVFPDRQKRIIVGFSRGAMGALETEFQRPNFAALHVLIAPYYPKNPQRLRPCDIVEKYVQSKTEVYIYAGENDEWKDAVDSILGNFRSNYMMEKYLLYDVEIPGMNHENLYHYAVDNPGLIWMDLECYFDKIKTFFSRSRSDAQDNGNQAATADISLTNEEEEEEEEEESNDGVKKEEDINDESGGQQPKVTHPGRNKKDAAPTVKTHDTENLKVRIGSPLSTPSTLAQSTASTATQEGLMNEFFFKEEKKEEEKKTTPTASTTLPKKAAAAPAATAAVVPRPAPPVRHTAGPSFAQWATTKHKFPRYIWPSKEEPSTWEQNRGSLSTDVTKEETKKAQLKGAEKTRQNEKGGKTNDIQSKEEKKRESFSSCGGVSKMLKNTGKLCKGAGNTFAKEEKREVQKPTRTTPAAATAPKATPPKAPASSAPETKVAGGDPPKSTMEPNPGEAKQSKMEKDKSAWVARRQTPKGEPPTKANAWGPKATTKAAATTTKSWWDAKADAAAPYGVDQLIDAEDNGNQAAESYSKAREAPLRSMIKRNKNQPQRRDPHQHHQKQHPRHLKGGDDKHWSWAGMQAE